MAPVYSLGNSGLVTCHFEFNFNTITREVDNERRKVGESMTCSTLSLQMTGVADVAEVYHAASLGILKWPARPSVLHQFIQHLLKTLRHNTEVSIHTAFF